MILYPRISLAATPLLVFAVLFPGGCKEGAIGSDAYGSTTGAAQNFKGLWVSGFESSIFSPCDGPAQKCTFESGNKNCWIQGISAPGSEMSRFLSDEQLTNAHINRVTVYMEFTGRRSHDKKGYGHLGDYPCLIEVEKITYAKLQES